MRANFENFQAQLPGTKLLLRSYKHGFIDNQIWKKDRFANLNLKKGRFYRQPLENLEKSEVLEPAISDPRKQERSYKKPKIRSYNQPPV